MFSRLREMLEGATGGRPQQRGMTADNRTTNRLVSQGRLPREQAEIYPQRMAAYGRGPGDTASSVNMGRMRSMQMQQDAGGYGAPIEAAGDSADGFQPMYPNMPSSYMQGGAFNPGHTPLQSPRLRYEEKPQHPYSLF